MSYVQQVYQAKEVIESNVQIKQALCATIIDTDRVCLGTEDGLFCIELMKESKFKSRIWNQVRMCWRESTQIDEKSTRADEMSAKVGEKSPRDGEKLLRVNENSREWSRSQWEMTRCRPESKISKLRKSFFDLELWYAFCESRWEFCSSKLPSKIEDVFTVSWPGLPRSGKSQREVMIFKVREKSGSF